MTAADDSPVASVPRSPANQALPHDDLATLENHVASLDIARWQAMAWEVLKMWDVFPEVDRIQAHLEVARGSRMVEGANGLMPVPHNTITLSWSMSAHDGRNRIEEYVIHRAVGDSPWDQAHHATGNRSPYGAWATSRLMRWGVQNHRGAQAFVEDLISHDQGLVRENPVAPLVGIVERALKRDGLPQDQALALAKTWGEQAQAWLIAQEQAVLRTILETEATESVPTSSPRVRL